MNSRDNAAILFGHLVNKPSSGMTQKSYNSSRGSKPNRDSQLEKMAGQQDNKKRPRTDVSGAEDSLSPSARASAPKKMSQHSSWDDTPSHRLRSASWETNKESQSGAPATNLRSSTTIQQNLGKTGTVPPIISNTFPNQFLPEYMKEPRQGPQGTKPLGSTQNNQGDRVGEKDPPPGEGAGISLLDVMSKLEKLEGLSSLANKIDDMAEDLKLLRDIKETTTEMRQDITEVQGKVQHLENKVSALEDNAVNEEQNRQLLAKEILDLKSQLKDQGNNRGQGNGQPTTLQSEWDLIKNKMEAFQRKQNLIIEGIRETRSECNNTVYTQVHSFLRNTLGIREVVISMAYRIGQPRAESSNPRPILIRFPHPEDRMQVWAARSRIHNRPNNNFIIREDLPFQLRSVQASLLRVAAIAKKHPDKYENVSVKDFRLHLNGNTYGVEDLEKLPRDLRPSFTSTPGNVKVVVFFGRASRFSNHYPSNFTVGDMSYNTVEQYLAHNRAILAAREDLGRRAMASPDPLESKRVLNILGAMPDQESWEQQRRDILFTGLMAKFSQNQDLKDYLLSSTDRQIGEASTNKTWGIGLMLTDRNRLNTKLWRGNNLQGRTLMEVRESLQANRPNTSEETRPADAEADMETADCSPHLQNQLSTDQPSDVTA